MFSFPLRLIGICVYNTVVMCAVGVTVSFVMKGNATVTYAFQAVCVLFCSTITILLIFVPKVGSILWLFVCNMKKKIKSLFSWNVNWLWCILETFTSLLTSEISTVLATNCAFQMKHIHKYGASGPGTTQEASITFQYSLKSAGKQARELRQTAT